MTIPGHENLLSPSTGYLGRTIDGSAVSSPQMLRLQGDRLLWSSAMSVREIEVKGMLDRFLSLSIDHPTDNEDVLAFAKNFGPLWLCEKHSLVAYHQPIQTMAVAIWPAVPTASETLVCVPRVARKSPRVFSESIADWRRLAAKARDLLNVAAALSRHDRVDGETWRRLDGMDSEDPALKQGHWSYLSDPEWRLAENLNRWIAIGDVRFGIGVEDGNLRPQLSANRFTWSVLALVALEIVAATVQAGALSNCSGCKRLFFTSASQPTPGEKVGNATAHRTYCIHCRRDGLPNRDAQRDARARRKTDVQRKPTRKSEAK
jgi:hypothetical protein